MKFLRYTLPFVLAFFVSDLFGQTEKEKELIDQALQLLNDKKYIEARNICNDIIQINPLFPRAYNIRGITYKEDKKFDLAFEDFDKAIALNPKYPQPYYNKADVYVVQGNYQQALAEYNKVFEFDSSSKAARYMRGMMYWNIGEYALGIKDLKKVLEIDPDDGMTYVYLITLLIRTNEFTEAAAYYDKYREKKERYSFFENNRYWIFYTPYLKASTFFSKGDYSLALSYIDQSIRTFESSWENSVYSDVLLLKGKILEKSGRYREAENIYEQVLAMSGRGKQSDVVIALAELKKKQETISKNDKILPEIELISPSPTRGLSIVNASQATEIIGRARDASGIAQVKVNGKTVKPEEDGLFILTLQLKAGNNEINISATDKEGNIASKVFVVKGNAVASEAEPVAIIPANTSPRYHAILIAEQDYNDPTISDLENPIIDANELKQILQSEYTFEPGNIETLYNRSREQIMQAIVQKSNVIGENDNLLIFYAGHGIAEKDKYGDIEGYWVPSSAIKGNTATYISADDIRKALKTSNSKHVLVIADACFSGAFTRELSSGASLAIQKQYSVPSRKIMASGNMEPVPDNSRFIYHLKKSLKENREKYLTAKKLYDGFYEAILNNSDTSPQYAAIKNAGDEGGEFVFIKK